METNIPTLSQIEKSLEAQAETLKTAAGHLASARRAHEVALNQFVPEDTSLTAVTRREEADRDLRITEREVAATAAAARAESHRFAQALAGAAAPKLSAAEHAIANSRRSEVEHDVATLDVGDLVGRMRAAIVANDRPAMLLYSQLVASRPAVAEGGMPDDGDALQAIGALAQQMRNDLRDPGFDEPREAVHKALGAIADLERDATARRVERESEEAVKRIYAATGSHGTLVKIPSDEVLAQMKMRADQEQWSRNAHTALAVAALADADVA